MTGNVMFHEFIKKSVEEENTKRELSDDEDKEDIKIEETDSKVEIDPKIRKKKRTT